MLVAAGFKTISPKTPAQPPGRPGESAIEQKRTLEAF